MGVSFGGDDSSCSEVAPLSQMPFHYEGVGSVPPSATALDVIVVIGRIGAGF